MKIKNKLVIIFLLFFGIYFLFFPKINYGFSDPEGGQVKPSSLPARKNIFSIQYVKSNIVRLKYPNNIDFDISYNRENWYQINISVGDILELSCGDKNYIRVGTNKSKPPIEYELECQERYSVGWNEEKEIWDIYHLQAR